MTENLFAYTPPGGLYPEYASLNEGDDGKVTLTVRGPAEYPGGSVHAHVGPQGTIDLPPDQLKALAWGILEWLFAEGLLKDDPPLARVRAMPTTLAAGCCSSVLPCGHQKAHPDSICGVCTLAGRQ